MTTRETPTTWPITSSRTVYENRWIVVTEDQVTHPSGDSGIYAVLELRDPAVFIVAVTDTDEIVLVTVARHTVGTSVEVPAGGSDGEDLEAAARRELLEETGYTATTWRRIGDMTALNGLCRAPETVFLATGVARADPGDVEAAAAAAAVQAAEGISEVRAVPVPEVLRMIRDGEITDGETVAAVFYAMLELGRVR